MSKKLRVLIVEDSEDDAELLLRELRSGGYAPLSERVETHKAMADALKKKAWDVIITDYSMPHFNGFQALEMLRSSAIDIPCIVVSGKIGEDIAVQLMKAGANDYVMKGNLKRLASAIERELGDAEVRWERRLAEEALRESEARYRLLAEHTTDVIRLLDMDLKTIYLSPSAEKQRGFTLQEMIEMPLERQLTPESLRTAYAVFSEEIPRVESDLGYDPIFTLDLEYYCKDGTTIWTESKFSLIRDENGRTVSILAEARDISERKRVEEEVRASQRLLKKVMSSLLDPIFIIDANTVEIIDCNPAASVIFGYTREEMVGKTTTFLHVNQSTLDEFRQYLNSAVEEKGFLFLPEYRMRRKDASIFPTENSVVPILDEKGKRAGWVSMIRDITERKQAEEMLRESEGKHRAVVEMASDVIVIIQDGVIRFANPRVTTMLGYETGEIEGMEFVSFIPPESQGLALERYQKRMAGEKLPGIYETELLHKNGREIPVETSGSLIEYAGKPADLAIIRDITERREGEAALRSKQIMLARTEGIAHVGSWEWDIATDTVTWSDELFRIFQRDPQEGAPSFAEHPAFYHPDDMTRLLQAVEAAVADGTPYELELRVIRKDGEIRVCVARGVAEMGPGGRAVRLFGSVQDITERKQSEAKLVKSYENLQKTLNDAINTMVKIVETRDPYTAGHQHKVADLAVAIAGEMKLEDTRIDQLRKAAIIHDIGKMYVPSDILSKPGQLTDLEFSLIKTHAQAGYDIVKGMAFPCNVAKAILQHHERLDGSGYPNQLKGEDTLLEAKILAVADVIEAMASHRPYRAALGIDKALEEISKNTGRLYDPGVVKACLELFTEKNFKFKD